MAEPIDIIELLQRIQSGDLDQQLDQITAACRAREKFVAVQAGHQLKPGDRVRITGGRPRYIIGELATVKEVMQTWIRIRLDNSVGKFSNIGDIRCPMTIVEKVES